MDFVHFVLNWLFPLPTLKSPHRSWRDFLKTHKSVTSFPHLKLLSGSWLLPHKVQISQLSRQGSMRFASADSAVLSLDSFLQWLQMWRRTGNSFSSLSYIQPHGLAIPSISVTSCLNVPSSQKAFLDSFLKIKQPKINFMCTSSTSVLLI